MMQARQASGAVLDGDLEPDPVIEVYKQHVDRSLLRANLQKTPDERVRSLMRLQRLAREARAAGGRLRDR